MILRIGKIVLAALAVLVVIVFLANASWLWGRSGHPTLLAHRGVAQQFSRDGLDRQTCTAAQMLPPTHEFIENTLPSIREAFELGADVVEIDIHPTTDGEFAVFHDWTLECRTNGQGVTREQPMSLLRTLDIGYGYTADGGQTFPFRGRFVGAMPTLGEVLRAFPTQRFLINVKSNDSEESDLLAVYLNNHAADWDRLLFYGGEAPMARLQNVVPSARTVSRSTMKRCVVGYLAVGWFGQVPSACENTAIFVPVNYRLLLWGWPNLFVDRMRAANTDVFVVGPLNSETDTSGVTSIDDPAVVDSFIDGFSGGIATDRIDVVGPHLRPEDR